MKILHVCIGRAPFYTGGSVKYAEELMKQQILDGDQVSILIPGHSSMFSKTKITLSSSRDEVTQYEIVNPLPVALLSGIGEPKRFIDHKKTIVYDAFLRNLHPDVIHVHSIMGIHLSFFQRAKSLHIPMIFTTHDYFPICVRGTLLDSTHRLCIDHTPAKCAACNLNAGLPRHWERFIRSRTYRKVKHASLIKKLRFWARSKMKAKSKSPLSSSAIKPYQNLNELSLNLDPKQANKVQDYQRLLNQYSEIMACFEAIHCNSELSRSIYISYFPQLKTVTKVITHGALPVKGTLRDRLDHEFRVGYMGGLSYDKGFYTLLEAFKALPDQSMTWKLVLWGDDYSSAIKPNHGIENKGKFNLNDYALVFSSMDVLIVPSISYESFGFVVLEALSYGLPVICSDRVGAKMLLSPLKDTLVYPADSSFALGSAIQALSNDSNYENTITELKKMEQDFSFIKHSKDIQSLYRDVIKEENR